MGLEIIVGNDTAGGREPMPDKMLSDVRKARERGKPAGYGANGQKPGAPQALSIYQRLGICHGAWLLLGNFRHFKKSGV